MLREDIPDITEVYDLLYRLGITGNYMGFFQTAYAVYLAVRQPERLILVTKWLYPEVAKHYKTTWTSVERNIRTVAGIAWNSNRSYLEHLARKPLNCRPAPSCFLSILTMHFQCDSIA